MHHRLKDIQAIHLVTIVLLIMGMGTNENRRPSLSLKIPIQ